MAAGCVPASDRAATRTHQAAPLATSGQTKRYEPPRQAERGGQRDERPGHHRSQREIRRRARAAALPRSPPTPSPTPSATSPATHVIRTLGAARPASPAAPPLTRSTTHQTPVAASAARRATAEQRALPHPASSPPTRDRRFRHVPDADGDREQPRAEASQRRRLARGVVHEDAADEREVDLVAAARRRDAVPVGERARERERIRTVVLERPGVGVRHASRSAGGSARSRRRSRS